MKLLREVNMGRSVTVGKEVVVIGGGNVAIDCARVMIRLGARVTILYRRIKEEMPALDEEIHEAEMEGIHFIFLGAPHKVIGKNARVHALEVMQMKLGEYDLAGRIRPEPTGKIYPLKCDMVITAIGGRPDTGFLKKSGISLSKNGTVEVDTYSLQTSTPKIYAGGDLVMGPYTASDAMGHGKQFARIIDTQLMGNDRFDQLKKDLTYSMEVSVEPQGGERNQTTCATFDAYKGNFKEVTASYTKEQALSEAIRCLRCDVKEEEEEEEDVQLPM
jgi:NADH-quinone oxidoreductase subunit F